MVIIAPPCETSEAIPVLPVQPHAAADTTGLPEAECAGCGKAKDLAWCPGCSNGIGGFWCGDGRCQLEHLEHCAVTVSYAMAGGWDE